MVASGRLVANAISIQGGANFTPPASRFATVPFGGAVAVASITFTFSFAICFSL